MTSTSFNIGLSDNTRLSSRVLRPPGGGHTDIFGGEPEPPRTGRRMVNSVVAASADPPSAPAAEEAAKQTAEAPQVEHSAPASAPAEPTVAAPPAPAQDKPAPAPAPQPAQPQRVRVPPGGYSSGLW